MHLFNTPPLKGKRFTRIPTSSRVSEATIQIFEIELKAMGWANGKTDWSRSWGNEFVELARGVQMHVNCLHKLYYNK